MIQANRSFSDEVRLYEHALAQAREHLEQWDDIRTEIDKTLGFAWSVVRRKREAEVKELELLIQRVKQSF